MLTQISVAKDKITNAASLLWKYIYKIPLHLSNLPENKDTTVTATCLQGQSWINEKQSILSDDYKLNYSYSWFNSHPLVVALCLWRWAKDFWFDWRSFQSWLSDSKSKKIHPHRKWMVKTMTTYYWIECSPNLKFSLLTRRAQVFCLQMKFGGRGN